MVIGQDNMWVNVHPVAIKEPWHPQFSWEFEDRGKWAPLYTTVHTKPLSLPDAQPTVLYYQPAFSFIATVGPL